MSNVLSGEEAQQILLSIDNEQPLPEELRERLTRLSGRYEQNKIAADVRAKLSPRYGA